VTTQAIAINAAARQRYLLVLLFAGFVLTGVEITLTGPMMPLFISRWSLNDSRAGLLLAIEFSGSLAGVWLSSLVTNHLGTRTSLVLGYLTIGVGLATVNASSMTVVVLALGALGIGYGLVVPPTNLAVAEIGGAKSASLVSLVNFAWGAGAVSCSPLVLLALKNGILPAFLFVAAGCGGLLAFSFLFATFPEARHTASDATSQKPAIDTGLATTLTLAALFFLYVSVEVSLGSWSAAYAKRLPGGGNGLSTIAPMFFYGGLLAGRASAPLVLARVREFRLVGAALLVVIAGTIVFVLAPTQEVAFTSAVVAGLGCAAVFPIYVTWLSRWYGARAASLGSIMFSMSSIGSATGPWLVGFVSAHAGGLRAGLLVPLAAATAMLFLLLLVRRQAAA
jgi:FHS family glucose/mannose:H+ symporter-like MFS transporter